MKELTVNNYLAPIIRDLRIDKASFAKAIGVDRTIVYSYLNNKSQMKKTTFDALLTLMENKGLSLDSYIFPPHEEGVFYHGSKAGLVGTITTHASKRSNDFGDGFYLGETLRQAALYVSREPHPVIYRFRIDERRMKTLRFDLGKQNLIDWVFYIAANRENPIFKNNVILYDKCHNLGKGQDVVIGPIADNNVAVAMSDFFANVIDIDTLIAAINGVRLGNQHCIKNEIIANSLSYEEEMTIDDNLKSYLSNLKSNEYDQAKKSLSSLKEKVQDPTRLFKNLVKNHE